MQIQILSHTVDAIYFFFFICNEKYVFFLACAWCHGWSCLQTAFSAGVILIFLVQCIPCSSAWQPCVFFLLSDLAELAMLTAPAALPALFLLQFTPRSQHHYDLRVTFTMAIAMPNPSSLPQHVSPRWELRKKGRVRGMCAASRVVTFPCVYTTGSWWNIVLFWGNAISWDYISCHRVGSLFAHLLLA